MIRWNSMDMIHSPTETTPPASPSGACATALLILVFHAGTPVDTKEENSRSSKLTDVQTLRATLQRVIQSSHPQLLDRVICLVPCVNYAVNAQRQLQSLTPWSHQDDMPGGLL